MGQKEQTIRSELAELETRLQNPAIFSDKLYPKLAKRRSELEHIASLFDQRSKLQRNKAEAKSLKDSSDSDMQRMALAELEEVEGLLHTNEEKLIEALTPQDPNNER